MTAKRVEQVAREMLRIGALEGQAALGRWHLERLEAAYRAGQERMRGRCHARFAGAGPGDAVDGEQAAAWVAALPLEEMP